MIGTSHESRGLNSETIETSDSPHCRTNETPQTKKDREDVNDDKMVQDHFQFSTEMQTKVQTHF